MAVALFPDHVHGANRAGGGFFQRRSLKAKSFWQQIRDRQLFPTLGAAKDDGCLGYELVNYLPTGSPESRARSGYSRRRSPEFPSSVPAARRR